MTIRISNGQLIITRPGGGGTLFNVDDKLLHITNTLQGVLSIPARSLGGGSGGVGFVNDTTNYDLGPVNAFATQVIGAVKFVVTTGSAGLAYNRWHMLMGGTVVWVMDGSPSITSLGGNSNSGVSQMVTYHFEISAGPARMVRRFVGNTAFGYQVRAHDIEYKLRAGAWV